MSQINLLIVEDEPIIAEDIAVICEKYGGYTVVDTAYSAGQAMVSLDRHHIDLVLLDINLEDEIDGLDIAEHLVKNKSTPFVYITSYADKDTVERVKRTNPLGFIVKPFNKAQLLSTLEIALFNYAQMQIPGGPDLKLLNEKLIDPLTSRESSILHHIYNGKTNKQMADLEYLSVNTVKYHIKNLYLKLDVSSRSQLLARIRNL